MRYTFTLGILSACGLLAAPTLADELIVTSESGVVDFIDLDTGATGFRGLCTGTVRSMAVADGIAFMGDEHGTVFSFDLSQNQILGVFSVQSDNAAMAWVGDRLMVAGSNGDVLVVNPDTQSIDQTIPTGQSDVTSIGVDAGGVFVGGLSSIAARAPLGGDDFSIFAACGSQIQAMAFGSNTMFLGGVPFFGTDEAVIYTFDKFVGGVNYTNTFNAPNDGTALLAHGGLLYVGGSDGSIAEMDPDTGEVLRTFVFTQPITGIAPSQGLTTCPADYDTSGDLNFFDVATFINLYIAELPAGDANGDGVFDFFDVQRFIDLFSTGCP